MAKVKVNWTIDGMTCSGCAQIAATVAQGSPGLDEIVIRYASQTFKATIDKNVFNLELLIDKLAQAGYTLKPEEETFEDRFTRERKAIKSQRLELIFTPLFAMPLLYMGMTHKIEFPYVVIQGFLALILSGYFGRNIHRKAFSMLKTGHFNMDTLISLGSIAAYCYSLYNVILGEHEIYFESAGLIIAFILIGKYFEQQGKLQNAKAIESLFDLQPKQATRIIDGSTYIVDVAEIEIDELVLVKPGERIPVDGIVVEGISIVNESSFTGESAAVTKKKGSQVWAGTNNGAGSLTINVVGTGRSSALGGIIQAVLETQEQETNSEQLTDRISKIFVPSILLLSLFTGVFWTIAGEPMSVIFAINVLVIACPCALGLATPLAMVAATGKAAKNRILVRNSRALEKVYSIKHILWDKTGTLTKGRPMITKINGEIKTYRNVLIALNQNGSHPLNNSIRQYFGFQGRLPKVQRFKAVPGRGIQGKIDGEMFHLGSPSWFNEITGNIVGTGKTTSVLFKDDKALMTVLFEDTLANDALDIIQYTNKLRISNTLLSGDKKIVVEQLAKRLGIRNYFGDMLPLDKVEKVKEYKEQGTVLMVGDGINDTAALSNADIGLSFASATEAAQQNSDIVLMQEGILGIKKVFQLAQEFRTTLRGNLTWAFGYNIIAIPIAAGLLYPSLGIKLSPMVASIAMSMSSIGVVLNSLKMHLKPLKT